MDKKAYVSLIALLMVFVGFQFVEPAAAVQVVDHGTHYFWFDNSKMKMVWTTYQYNTNFLKTKAVIYYKYNNRGKYHLAWHEVITISKVTKSTVKIKDWTDSDFEPPTTVNYKKTKLTAAQYYWKTYRSEMLY